MLTLVLIIAAIIVIAVGIWAYLRTQEETLDLQRYDLETKDIRDQRNNKKQITEGLKTASMTRQGEKVRFKMRDKLITGYRAKRFGQNGWDYYYEDGSLIDDVVDLIIFIELLDSDMEFGISGQTFDPMLLEMPDVAVEESAFADEQDVSVFERETKPTEPPSFEPSLDYESSSYGYDSSSGGGYDGGDSGGGVDLD